MKDPTRHLRSIQRKVIRSCRQETVSLASPANGTTHLSDQRLEEPKRRRLLVPKLMKAQAYH